MVAIRSAQSASKDSFLGFSSDSFTVATQLSWPFSATSTETVCKPRDLSAARDPSVEEAEDRHVNHFPYNFLRHFEAPSRKD